MTATVTTVSGVTSRELRLVAPVDEAGRQVEQQIDDARRLAVARPSRRANSFSSFGPMPGSADSGANSGLSTGGRIALSCLRHSGAPRSGEPGIHNHRLAGKAEHPFSPPVIMDSRLAACSRDPE